MTVTTTQTIFRFDHQSFFKRWVRAVTCAVIGFTVLISAGQTVVQAANQPQVLSAEEAYKQAQAGKILLIDIRDPQEWRETGVPRGAYLISLSDRSFLKKLVNLTAGDKTAPIAVICATGSRSSWLQKQLKRLGYRNVIDVSEGMIGNRRGVGWLRKGLPVDKWRN